MIAKDNLKFNDKYTYFFTTKHASLFEIKKLHLCTWLYPNGEEVAEIGFQVNLTQRESLAGFPLVCENKYRAIDITAWIPWMSDTIEIEDLYQAISDKKNAQFIFNDNCPRTTSLASWDNDVGQLLEFENRGPLAVVRVNSDKKSEGKVELKVLVPKEFNHDSDIYGRICLKVPASSIAFRQSTIAHTLYAYNINVGQLRNAPNGFPVKERCVIGEFFCIHIVPSAFRQTFYGTREFRNLRFLERDRYNDYIAKNTILNHRIDKDELVVSFNKRRIKASAENEYAFYTSFERDLTTKKHFWISLIINVVATMCYGILVWVMTKGALAWLAEGGGREDRIGHYKESLLEASSQGGENIKGKSEGLHESPSVR